MIISGKDGLHISSDQGKTWRNVKISNDSANALLSNDEHNYTMFLLGDKLAALRSDFPNKNAGNGKLQVSSDGGTTWQNHTSDATLQTLEGISKVLMLNDVLYCSYNGGIMSSVDGGKTWQIILQQTNIQSNMTIELYADEQVMYAISKNMGC